VEEGCIERQRLRKGRAVLIGGHAPQVAVVLAVRVCPVVSERQRLLARVEAGGSLRRRALHHGIRPAPARTRIKARLPVSNRAYILPLFSTVAVRQPRLLRSNLPRGDVSPISRCRRHRSSVANGESPPEAAY